MPTTKNKRFIIISLFLAFTAMSCSHHPTQLVSSTRDYTPNEKQVMAYYSGHQDRTPADWVDNCTNVVRNFFNRPKPTAAVDAVVQKSLPELTQLNPVHKQFANGKKYIEYTANTNVMNKYPEYDEYLAETAEIIFEPVEPFGHINLRVGKKIYSFNNVQWTSINKFSPRMKKSTNPEMPGSTGYVFLVGKEKIEAMEKDIVAFYESSSSKNIPPFDAYSPLLKIFEEDGAFGKTLKFKSESPKFGNENQIKGSIVEENGKYYLDAGNGVRVDVIKKGDDYFTQSYSCSSSAGHIMQKFFGIDLSYDGAAKSIQQSLANGNMHQNISPVGVIKYYEEQ